jgi:hypothetical protein
MAEPTVYRKLLQKHLRDLDPNFPTGLENVAFKPTVGKAYQVVTLMKSKTQNPTMGVSNFYREAGSMQVALYFPTGAGTKDAEEKSKAIRNRFKRGTTLTEGTLRVLVPETPYEQKGANRDEWYQLLVYVPYIVDVH